MSQIDNPNNASLDDIRARLDALESAAPVGFTSITRGSLRVASVEGLIVEGSARVSGVLIVSGEETVDGILTVSGTLVVTGTTSITGTTEISGTTSITGPTDVTGPMVFTGTLNIDGDTIISGDLEIIGTSVLKGDLAVLDDGRIRVGTQMVIDPSEDGGAVRFNNGSKLFSNSSSIGLRSGSSSLNVSPDLVALLAGSRSVNVTPDGIRLVGADLVSSIDGLTWLAATGSGEVVRVPQGIGGPGGGSYEWPFPESTITYGFRPPDRPTHDGLDFAGPEVTGHLIRAVAQGVVAYAGYSSGYGNYVDLNHPPIAGQSVMSRYGHMATTPYVSTGDPVPKLGVLGPVGNTGASEGDHLHLEIWVDGEPTDPAAFLAAHGA